MDNEQPDCFCELCDKPITKTDESVIVNGVQYFMCSVDCKIEWLCTPPGESNTDGF